MSQEQSTTMLATIEWANARIEELGLGSTCCIVYTGGAARLLSASGKERIIIAGDAQWAIPLVLARLEDGLKKLLYT